LGPGGQWARDQLQAALGVELATVDRLCIAFVPDDSGAPQCVYIARLSTPLGDNLPAAWKAAQLRESNGKSYYHGAELGYYLPASEDRRIAVVGPKALVDAIVTRDGPPLLRKGLERLLRSSDGARHVTLIVDPRCVLSDGQSLLAGDLAKLRVPLRNFLGDSI